MGNKPQSPAGHPCLDDSDDDDVALVTWPRGGPKPKRDGLASYSGPDDSDEDGISSRPRDTRKRSDARRTNIRVELPPSALVHPSAKYDRSKSPPPSSTERDALSALMHLAEARRRERRAAFAEFRLDSFVFYVNSALYPCEMRPLQHLATRVGHDRFYFDGELSVDGVSHRVERVEVAELPVGNYGPTHATVRGQVWVRSRRNANRELYYRLGTPSPEYARFHAPFLWVADLAKHAVDYTGAMLNQEGGGGRRPVSLGAFGADFVAWLAKTHASSPAFARWRRQHPGPDYRASVVANIDFVWKEVNGVLGLDKARALPLFHETMTFSLYRQPALPSVPKVVRGSEEVMSTIVTPYIAECFGHMHIGAVLAPVPGSAASPVPCRVGSPRPPPGVKRESLSPAPPPPPPPPPLAPPPAPSPSRSPTARDPAHYRRSRNSEPCFLPLSAIDQIKPGDTISTPRDPEATTDTKWRRLPTTTTPKDSATTSTTTTDDDDDDEDRWFGLVQKVHVDTSARHDGARAFDVIWYYRPADTPCCLMRYPWRDELFLSDHCTCEEGAAARVREHQVLGVHRVDWFGAPGGKNRRRGGAGGEFFVRQTYVVAGRRWITLLPSHMMCAHGGPERPAFGPGDAVLAARDGEDKSEVYEVMKAFRQGGVAFVRLRRLLKRREVDDDERGYIAIDIPQVPANELVYTDRMVVMKADEVIGKCVVRCFGPGERIPTPYDRGGAGNLFFMTRRIVDGPHGQWKTVSFAEAKEKGDGDGEVDGDGFPVSLRQGFDPTRPPSEGFRKLRGMDLFCGSGNFGRGLEEGGAVEMRWANDIWDRAIHTYMANSENSATNPDAVPPQPFLGSVDELLLLALQGKHAPNVPRPGEVDFISAGSPCPGFSLLTQDKTTLAQIKNQSLVASFASFVDLYRPLYGVLENVATIVQARHKRAGDVLSQLLCAIVGMGYQAQLMLGDAWSHGAPQGRTRVFLYFAAPDLALPEPPLLSHSHHPGVRARGIGEMANGEPFVARSAQPAPLLYVGAGEATDDLPDIGDGKPEPAVAFPDHRVCGSMTERLRHQIAAIPKHPYGMSFSKAWYGGGEGRDQEEDVDGVADDEAADDDDDDDDDDDADDEDDIDAAAAWNKKKGKAKAKHKTKGRGVMTSSDRALFPEAGFRVRPISKGWRRARRQDVFQTVTTRSQPTDARAGTGLHWAEDRPMTVLEMRRAQGFPDDEVLLGTPADQWKLVGNSVAGQMALALGVRFREAWAGGLGDEVGAPRVPSGDGDGEEAGSETDTSDAESMEDYAEPDLTTVEARIEAAVGAATSNQFGPRGPPELITLDSDFSDLEPVSPATARRMGYSIRGINHDGRGGSSSSGNGGGKKNSNKTTSTSNTTASNNAATNGSHNNPKATSTTIPKAVSSTTTPKAVSSTTTPKAVSSTTTPKAVSSTTTPKAASTATTKPAPTTTATAIPSRSRSTMTYSHKSHKHKPAAYGYNEHGLTPIGAKGKRDFRTTTTSTTTRGTATGTTNTSNRRTSNGNGTTTPTSRSHSGGDKSKSRSRSTTTTPGGTTTLQSTTPIPLPTTPPEMFYGTSRTTAGGSSGGGRKRAAPGEGEEGTGGGGKVRRVDERGYL